MRYETPETKEEAVSLLSMADGSGRVLAGGTDLLVQLRSGMIDPDVVVDIKKIAETRGIVVENGLVDKLDRSVCEQAGCVTAAMDGNETRVVTF